MTQKWPFRALQRWWRNVEQTADGKGPGLARWGIKGVRQQIDIKATEVGA